MIIFIFFKQSFFVRQCRIDVRDPRCSSTRESSQTDSLYFGVCVVRPARLLSVSCTSVWNTNAPLPTSNVLEMGFKLDCTL